MKNETEAADAWTIPIAMNHRGGKAEKEGIQSSTGTGMYALPLAAPIRPPLNRAEKERGEGKNKPLV